MTEYWARELVGIDLNKPQVYIPDRKSLAEIYGGDDFGFKQLYSMHYSQFLRLAYILQDAFNRCGGGKSQPIDLCLGVAIQCFRGNGRSLCTASQIHGMTRKDAFEGTGFIVEAIHMYCEENSIKFKKGTPMMQKVRKLVRNHLY